MKLEIITTGEEVLSGQITDTNAAWISQLLNQQGLDVTRRFTVGDRCEDLVDLFRERGQVADVVIVNGGLGPTVDDLSAMAAAQALAQPLVENADWVAVLTERYQKRNRPLLQANLKQALLPSGADLIDNPIGTACGFQFTLGKARFYFTPGVPSEMKRMLRDEILPDVQQRFQLKSHILLRRLHCFGIAESRLGSLLADIDLPQGIRLGFRPHLPVIEIKIMGRGEDEDHINARIDQTADVIYERVGAAIFAEEGQGFADVIQQAMIARGWHLALAESCTGGMVADMLVARPGSSAYFDRGFVTYSNQAKMDMLGVAAETLATHGAVSAATAREMALGARCRAGVDVAVSVTGIAGPDGGSSEKPVGTVGFALAVPDRVYTVVFHLPPWGRRVVRLISAHVALDLLRRYLAELPVIGEYDLGNPVYQDERPL